MATSSPVAAQAVPEVDDLKLLKGTYFDAGEIYSAWTHSPEAVLAGVNNYRLEIYSVPGNDFSQGALFDVYDVPADAVPGTINQTIYVPVESNVKVNVIPEIW